MASAEPEPAEPVAFTVERVRIDEEGGHCLISGADDEDEPAGYFIVERDAVGASLEFLGEDLSQRDGLLSLEIRPNALVFWLDPASFIGRRMPVVTITSREAIGPAVRVALKRAFGERVAETA